MKIINERILTEREKDILMQVLNGKNKREIANRLCLSVSTVKTYVENIYRKFNVHNKAELIIFVIKKKIVDLDDVI